MAKSIWLVALLALGCAEEPRRFSLMGFDDGETSVIQNAAAEWCATGAYCPIVSAGDNKIEVAESIPDPRCTGDCAALTVSTKDTTADGSTTIYLLDRRYDTRWLAMLRRNMLHEFGHAAGCWAHAPGTIMDEDDANLEQTITQYDIDCVR